MQFKAKKHTKILIFPQYNLFFNHSNRKSGKELEKRLTLVEDSL